MSFNSVTFHKELQTAYDALLENVAGINARKDQYTFATLTWYRFTLLRFLQSKRFLNQDSDYLARQWHLYQSKEGKSYYKDFFAPLIFQVTSVPLNDRRSNSQKTYGKIPYLPLNIFQKQPVENIWPDAKVQNSGFQTLFAILEQYQWQLTDSPQSHNNEIVPTDLFQFIESYVVDHSINTLQPTPIEFANHLCDRTICNALLSHFDNFVELQELQVPLPWILNGILTDAGAEECKIVQSALYELKILDPACGTGSILHAALNRLIAIYQLIHLRQTHLRKPALFETKYSNPTLFYKQQIINQNLFGVDINPEGILLTQFRFYLILVSSCQDTADLQALNNTQINIHLGNSLIGVTESNQLEQTSDRHLFHQVLLDEFQESSIHYEEATWNSKRNKQGHTKKRELILQDIGNLRPLHWAYEFPDIMQKGGFDIIVTNPPWRLLRFDEKAFFAQYSNFSKGPINESKAFLEQKTILLQDTEIHKEWLNNLSCLSLQISYFRRKESSLVNNRINLYHLFLFRSVELLNKNGYIGLIFPSGIQLDRSSIAIRRLLLFETSIDVLLDFENKQYLWPSVHHRFRFTLLTTQKKKINKHKFQAAFKIHDMKALRRYPLNSEFVSLDVDYIKTAFPNHLYIIPLKNKLEILAFKKLLKNPWLTQDSDSTRTSNTTFGLNITSNSDLLHSKKLNGDMPVIEGRVLQDYGLDESQIRYWVSETQIQNKYIDQIGDIKRYRLAVRVIASATNKRTIVGTILPKNKLYSDSILLINQDAIHYQSLLCHLAILNSIPYDWFIRVTMNHTRVSLEKSPIPCLTKDHLAYDPIVIRAAKLICTTEEFDELAAEVGLGSHANGITDPAQRAQLRAELDGLIAHIYGLTEAEFRHILSTFPLVAEEVKEAALYEYCKLAPDPEMIALITTGETQSIEFKQAACRNPHTSKNDNKMRDNIVKAIAAFMNSNGGTLLIGVTDDGAITGVDIEYPIANANKANWDGYELFLADLLNKSLSLSAAFQYFTITRHTINSLDVANVQVSPAPEPAYVNNKLYVRAGAQSKELQGPDLIGYVNSHWA